MWTCIFKGRQREREDQSLYAKMNIQEGAGNKLYKIVLQIDAKYNDIVHIIYKEKNPEKWPVKEKSKVKEKEENFELNLQVLSFNII